MGRQKIARADFEPPKQHYGVEVVRVEDESHIEEAVDTLLRVGHLGHYVTESKKYRQGLDILRRNRAAERVGKLIGDRWSEAQTALLRAIQRGATVWAVRIKHEWKHKSLAQPIPVEGLSPVTTALITTAPHRSYWAKNLFQAPNCEVKQADVYPTHRNEGLLAAGLYVALQEYSPDSLVVAHAPKEEPMPGHPNRRPQGHPLEILLASDGIRLDSYETVTVGDLATNLEQQNKWLTKDGIDYAAG